MTEGAKFGCASSHLGISQKNNDKQKFYNGKSWNPWEKTAKQTNYA